MPLEPGGKWKNVSAKMAEQWGFSVDRSNAMRWVAYRGPRESPFERHLIHTDAQFDERAKRQQASRAAEQRQRRIIDETELTAIVVCRERAYEVPLDVAYELDSRQARIDALMLEYCPEDMTPSQLATWGRNQTPAAP